MKRFIVQPYYELPKVQPSSETQQPWRSRFSDPSPVCSSSLVFWNHFDIGIAPVVVGLFFFGSVQLVALGVIGEYVGSIHMMVQNRPLVIEKERINFEQSPQRQPQRSE